MLSPANFTGVVRGATAAGTEAIRRAQRQFGADPDGALGKETIARLLDALERDGEAPTEPGTPDAKAASRSMIVRTAASFAGDVDPVTEVWAYVCPELARPEYRHSKSWCGGWALLVWKCALPKCATWMWDASGKASLHFSKRYGVKLTQHPEPGDIAYWPTLNGKTIHHYAIVRELAGDLIYTYDGNVTIAPSERVEPRTRSFAATKPAFFSAADFL
jgi:hypothetical protein